MNLNDWELKIKEALKIHISEINSYYKSHKNISFSPFNYTPTGGRKLIPSVDISHSDTLSTKLYKQDKESYNTLHITTVGKGSFLFQTDLKYYKMDDIIVPHAIEKNSGILLQEGVVRGCLIGGSPTFRYGKHEERFFWSDLLDKDVHFNQSLHENLLSYETYLVMREIYPLLPFGTILTVKELFNE